MNTLIQQDTFEFLTAIIGKLEEALKKTKFKYLLKSVFGGESSTQVKILCILINSTFAKVIVNQ